MLVSSSSGMPCICKLFISIVATPPQRQTKGVETRCDNCIVEMLSGPLHPRWKLSLTITGAFEYGVMPFVPYQRGTLCKQGNKMGHPRRGKMLIWLRFFIFTFSLCFQIPPSIDFCVTWIALSSSFWNPFLYWLLNARFRRICKEMLSSRVIIMICLILL